MIQKIRLACCLLLFCCIATNAWCAGLFLAPSGVRPLARAGAFVASVDDAYALQYNPAGLAFASNVIQLDAAMQYHPTYYTRRITASSADAATVEGHDLGVPYPNIGFVYNLAMLHDTRVGLSLSADYPLLQNWPSALTSPNTPQRYAAVNFVGTALGTATLAFANQLNRFVAIGAGLQLLAGRFDATSVISTCDGVICTQPENPAYDAIVQLKLNNIVVPGVQLGVIILPYAWLRLGVAWESGYNINSIAHMRLRLPTAALYQQAFVTPTDLASHTHMQLPQKLRVGAALLLSENARVELTYVFEAWSAYKGITIAPIAAQIHNVIGIGTYALSTLQAGGAFADTWSLRLGGEFKPHWFANTPLILRAGVMFEPSAIPSASLTAMSVDLDKFLVAGGLRYTLGALAFDMTLAHVFMYDRYVDDSAVFQINPTRPALRVRDAIGNGRYESNATICGIAAVFEI